MISNLIAAISLYLATALNPLPSQLNNTPVSVAAVDKNIEDYFKLVLASTGKEQLEYKVLEMNEQENYMKISTEINGTTYILDYRYWVLGLDLDSDDVLMAETVYKPGYGTMPVFYYYRNGYVERTKPSEIVLNWDKFEKFIESYEAMDESFDTYCCDVRVFVPKDKKNDLEVYAMKNKEAQNLTDRPQTNMHKLGILRFDLESDKFEFIMK